MQFHPKDLSELDELTEEHLGFSALSEGLGFSKQAKQAPQKPADPFEAPASARKDADLRARALSGTGAVAAGPARPVPAVSAPARAAEPAKVAPSRAVPAPSANVLAEPAAPRALRVAAFGLDLLLILVPMVFAWWMSFRARSWELFAADVKAPLLLFGLIFGVYFLLSESFGGQSLGKMMLGLRVVEDDKYQKPTGLGHAAKRLFLFVAGAALGGIGLLASFWDAKRRPWHDRYSGSIVRRKA